MWKDEILEEIYRYREEYARSFDYDLDAIFRDLRNKQNAHKQKVVTLPIKRKSNKSFEQIGQQ
jgi:hypothetical protein